MVIGLLTLAAIPTTIALCEGISEKNKGRSNTGPDPLQRKFRLTCWCEGRSPGKRDIHGGVIVIGDGKVWIQSAQAAPRPRCRPFEGFYIEYPDDQRPSPAPLGLVSQVADNPPLMNWLYVDRVTSEIRHGNRTQSRAHHVGDWGHTNMEDDAELIVGQDTSPAMNEEEEPSGVTFNGEERFVAVAPSSDANDGHWQIYWDDDDNKLDNGERVDGRRVLRISLERSLVDEAGS